MTRTLILIFGIALISVGCSEEPQTAAPDPAAGSGEHADDQDTEHADEGGEEAATEETASEEAASEE